MGNGILEAMGAHGERIELLRFSRTLSDPFRELATKLNMVLERRMVRRPSKRSSTC